MVEYQVTLLCATGEYKPVSTLVRRQDAVNLKDAQIKRQILNAGMQKICAQRDWTARDLATFGFKTGKVRLYDKEKIAAENAARYAKIKAEKYASGEWKRPKRESN